MLRKNLIHTISRSYQEKVVNVRQSILFTLKLQNMNIYIYIILVDVDKDCVFIYITVR